MSLIFLRERAHETRAKFISTETTLNLLIQSNSRAGALLTCSCARLFVCSCVLVLLCSCARVFLCSCTRVLVFSCARVQDSSISALSSDNLSKTL